ncbi:MAG: hypothetical protein AABX11_07745 [Nanoarchaeota archaeon]
MGEQYQVMTAEDVISYKEWVKKAVQQLHESKPDYIFLTESSAVPFGWTLKNAWKARYPNESVPKFFRTSITHGIDFNAHDYFSSFYDYFDKRVADKSKKVLIFDEYDKDNNGLNGAVYRVKDGIENTIKSENNTLRKNVSAFRTAGFKNILTFSGGYGLSKQVYGGQQSLDWIKEKEKITGKKLYVKPTGKNYDLPDLGGRIEKDPILKRRALDYIHDLKLAGKESGIEARQEFEKKKSLEGKVTSVISIGGLLGGLLFLSSNITGNVIDNMTNSSLNWIGGILFIIGLIAGFVYFKSR